jgi:hypothetical protein
MFDKHISSVDGLFGQKIHYDDMGNIVGESWPGLVEGSYVHYGPHGYAGESMPGAFADLVHYNADGQYVGDTWNGICDEQKVHYGMNGYAGDSWDTLIGTDTSLDADLFEPFE